MGNSLFCIICFQLKVIIFFSFYSGLVFNFPHHFLSLHFFSNKNPSFLWNFRTRPDLYQSFFTSIIFPRFIYLLCFLAAYFLHCLAGVYVPGGKHFEPKLHAKYCFLAAKERKPLDNQTFPFSMKSEGIWQENKKIIHWEFFTFGNYNIQNHLVEKRKLSLKDFQLKFLTISEI